MNRMNRPWATANEMNTPMQYSDECRDMDDVCPTFAFAGIHPASGEVKLSRVNGRKEKRRAQANSFVRAANRLASVDAWNALADHAKKIGADRAQ